MSRFLIDVNTLPRPERSGLLSMLAAYVLLVAYGNVVNGGPIRPFEEHWSDLLCYVFPCSFFSHPPQPPMEHDPQPKKHYRVVPLFFGSGVKGTKPICACHADIHYFGKPVMHLHFFGETTCDSDYPDGKDRQWTTPKPMPWQDTKYVPSGSVTFTLTVRNPQNTADQNYMMREGEGEYRFHCTTDDAIDESVIVIGSMHDKFTDYSN